MGHGESVQLWLKPSEGDIHVLVYANSAPRSSGGGITGAVFHKGEGPRGLGRDALNLLLKKRTATLPWLRSWPVLRSPLGTGSGQACCSVKTQRRQTQITKVSSALREDCAGLASHGIQGVTMTLPSSWTVALSQHCWDASRLPWEHAGALPVKTQTPQSCCKINHSGRAKWPAALSGRPAG